jgi:type III secretion protein F
MAGVTFDFINSSVSSVVNSAETTLKNRVASLDPASTSPTELLLLQQDVSKWTMMTQIQSTLVKELSDTMKGIIQKAG